MTQHPRDYSRRKQIMLSDTDAANYEAIAAWLRELGVRDNEAAVLRSALTHLAHHIKALEKAEKLIGL